MKFLKSTLVILGVLLCSCHKDLDIDQTSQLSATSMWTDENDAISAMYGTHQLLRGTFNNGLMYWGEYRTGLWGPGNHGGLSQTVRDQAYQNTMTNTHAYADWENMYETINMANLLLRYTPQITFSDQDEMDRVMANGYFVRAMCYYWIARIWGDAPLVLEGYESASQDLLPTRTPVADILSQVEMDIEAGLNLMPSGTSDRNIASQGALQMLMADYALWMYTTQNGGDTYLQMASNAVNQVLGMGYQLESNYGNIFDSSSESGPEVIYAWNYEQDEYTGGYPVDFQFNSATVSPVYHFNPVAVGTGQQWTFYTDDYVGVLTADPTDTRLTTNYLEFYDDLMGQEFHWTNKYKGSWVNNTLILDSDIILYRLADAYFYKAEIEFYNGDMEGAVDAINTVVQRAYGAPEHYTGTFSGSEVKEILVAERMREFPAEGKLWWDFIRLEVIFDINSYLTGREGSQNILLWPLSDNSINDNPNLGGQTPGWE